MFKFFIDGKLKDYDGGRTADGKIIFHFYKKFS